MIGREKVPEDHPENVAAKAITAQLLKHLQGPPNRVVVLAVLRTVCNLVCSMYEDHDDRIAYAEEFFDAVVETIQYNRDLN